MPLPSVNLSWRDLDDERMIPNSVEGGGGEISFSMFRQLANAEDKLRSRGKDLWTEDLWTEFIKSKQSNFVVQVSNDKYQSYHVTPTFRR